MTLLETKQHEQFNIAHFDFQKGLHVYASRKLNSHSLSEDLVQDTFTKAWKYIVKGGEIVVMKVFLYHILNGLIIDEYRKRKVVSLDVLIEKGFESEDEKAEQIEDIFDGRIAVLLIQELPIAYRKVMTMRYIQDLSLCEMSEITGKSNNTMAVHAHRGLEKLRVLYTKNY